jgi:hypothetical protein
MLYEIVRRCCGIGSIAAGAGCVTTLLTWRRTKGRLKSKSG